MRVLYLAAVAVCLAASPATAQSLKADEVYSSIAARTLSEPNPVLGADDRMHLAYELMVSNPSRLFMTIDRVEALDPTGRSIWSLAGDDLTNMRTLYSGTGNTIPPGGTAVVFMNVSFPAGQPLPDSVAARITATRQGAGEDGKPGPLPAGMPFPKTFTFTGAATTVGKAARIIEPPLRGSGWVAVNGCCDSITSHRGAVMTVNGRVRVPERFAIDWIQIDESSRAFTGDQAKLANWPFYGAPVHSVADGVVVNVYDGADEQVPGEPVEGITAPSIAGNMLVVDIGAGAFAFYAHLQPRSLKAKLGDQVKAGQVLGLLGNTGNSSAPHLHFHLMDGPSPLNANGLPYVFSRFSSSGTLAEGEEDAMLDGKAARVTDRLSGNHVNKLPLNNQVVGFD